MLLILQEY